MPARSRTAGVLCALAVSLSSATVLATAAPAYAQAVSPAPTAVRLGPSASSVPAGSRVGLHTQLTNSSGTPLYGRTVAYDAKRRDGTWAYLGAARTDSRGRALVAVTVAGTTTYRARHVGDSRWASSTSAMVTVTATATWGQQVVAEASRHAGKPYQWGAAGPDRFDCSGFTMYVFSRFGRSLPHNSGQQYSVVRKVAASDKRPGDLIFGHDNGRIHHVAIYAGDGYIWHSPHSGAVVRKVKIYDSTYYVGRVG